MPLTAQILRAHLSGDRAGARASKDRALGAFVRAKGAAAVFELGQALLDLLEGDFGEKTSLQSRRFSRRVMQRSQSHLHARNEFGIL